MSNLGRAFVLILIAALCLGMLSAEAAASGEAVGSESIETAEAPQSESAPAEAAEEAVDGAEPVSPAADGYEESSGTCGENVNWSFDEDTGVLTITGVGEMEDFRTAPWVVNYRNKIVSVVISSGVTSVSGYAFSGCPALPSVSLPDTLHTIAQYAFGWCTSLTSIEPYMVR